MAHSVGYSKWRGDNVLDPLNADSNVEELKG
jgi:hypothetical protein